MPMRPTLDLKADEVTLSSLQEEPPQTQNELVPVHPTGLAIRTLGGQIITAQNVTKPRDYRALEKRLQTLCAMNGVRYTYDWEVNDRATRTKKRIFDVSIKATNDLVREYGNCIVDTPMIENSNEGWTIYARFTDLESGYTLIRPFFQSKQRKGGQDVADSGRKLEMLFAMGVSKALRNVVKNALATHCDFILEEVERGIHKWVTENPERTAQIITTAIEELGLTDSQLEVVIGRKRKDWTVRNAAKVAQTLRAIKDGMTTIEEQFPSERDAAKVQAEIEAKAAKEEVKRDERTAEKIADAKAPSEPAGEPKAAEPSTPAAKAEEPQEPAAKAAEPKPEPKPKKAKAPEPEKEPEKVADPEPEPEPAPAKAAAPEPAAEEQQGWW